MFWNLTSLSHALLVSEHGSIRQAASALNVRPSVVSRRVRVLEEEIGIALFERRSSGVKLTPAGQVFFGEARCALAILDTAALRAAKVDRGELGRLVVTFYSSLISGMLREVLAQHRNRRPGVEITFLEAPPADQLAALRGHRADVAFLAGVEGAAGIEGEHLWDEHVSVALPKAHPLASVPAVGWADIRNESFIVRAYGSGPVIYTWLAGKLEAGGIAPAIRQLDVSRESLLGLVGAGYGLTVVSEAAATRGCPGVVFRSIRDASATMPIRMGWLATNENPALGPFLAHARRIARRHRRGVRAS